MGYDNQFEGIIATSEIEAEIEQITPPTPPNGDQPEGEEPWQTKARWDLENTSLSYAEIGLKYGRARDTIAKMKKRLGIKRKTRKKSGPPEALENTHFSPEHKALGIQINLYSDANPDLSLTELFRVSPQVLKRLRLGCYDLSVSQLLHISKVMDMSVTQLLQPQKFSAKPKR